MQFNNAINNARADAYCGAMNSGTLRLYNGTKPASANAALSGNTLLAQGTYAADAFPAATGAGTSTSAAITGANASATGTPTFGRTYATDGTTCLAQHDVTELTISPTSLTSGVAVTYNAIAHAEPAGV